ncbi:MAG: cell division protein FtsZ [Clostridia bacterium]|nr:cell division protein FtsZ [Clostridia bacterium]
MPLQIEQNVDNVVNIKVIGIGGGGNNAINRMVESNLQGVEFISVNTDKQQLLSAAGIPLQVGERITKGQGCGANPDKGKKALEENREDIQGLLQNTDMVFITAGMGGGTGTGGAPVVAEIARDMGILTVGVVTKPFKFEGSKRMKQAEEGIAALREKVDSLVVIPNERLKYVTEQKITFLNAFNYADDVLRQAVQSISDLIKMPGLVNLDFADVCAVMRDAGYAHMGVGRASGKEKALEAAKLAIQSPLLETSINGARGVLINIIGSVDIGLEEIETAASIVEESAHPDANIIFGAAIDESLDDEIKVTIIATGFDTEGPNPIKAPTTSAVVAEMVTGEAENADGNLDVYPQGISGEKEVKKSEDDPYGDIMAIFNKR